MTAAHTARTHRFSHRWGGLKLTRDLTVLCHWHDVKIVMLLQHMTKTKFGGHGRMQIVGENEWTNAAVVVVVIVGGFA